MRKSVIGVVVVAAMLVVGAPRARATTADPIFNVIPFSGSGSSGTMAPGVPWRITSRGGTSAFGSPGAGAGNATWPAPPTPGNITDFTITFSGLPQGVTINPASIGGCIGLSTSFCSAPFRNTWAPVLSNGNDTITFTAPMGISLNSGNQYFGNIHFTGVVSSVTFTGAWSSPSSPVPEPSSLLLFGTGLLLLVLIVSRKQLRTGQMA